MILPCVHIEGDIFQKVALKDTAEWFTLNDYQNYGIWKYVSCLLQHAHVIGKVGNWNTQIVV